MSLLLNPLIACIAAGNSCVLKPSEVSVSTSGLLARLIPGYLDPEAVCVVEGAVPESTALLGHQWDLIFYTGSTAVGRIVHAAAAKHLTPVVLELGGKCPAIIDDRVDLSTAVKRIIWGKFSLNMGQTCVCPDYVLCSRTMHSRVVQAMKQTLVDFYTESPKCT